MTAFYETNISTAWLRKRLKHLGKIYPGLAGKAGEDFSREQLEGFKPYVPFVSVANFAEVPKKYHYVRVRESEGQNKVKSGDLLFLMSSETLEDIGKSSIFEWDEETPYLNSFCKGFRADSSRVLPKFLNYSLMSTGYREYFANVARGFTRINLKQEYILNAQVSVPPLPEQRAIATLLDRKCATIDEAVRIKEEQIKLLRERRQILIQQAVTRGLNPDAPMKDSGIDWIGEIPAHWEAVPLKRLFQERNERTSNGTETLLSLRMVEGLVPHDEVSGKAISDAELVGYKKVYPGQLVMNRMRASIGLFGIVDQLGLVSPDYAIFDMRDDLFGPFYLNLFKIEPMGTRFRVSSRGLGTGSSGFMRLYTDDFGAITVPAPTREEQQEIVGYIDGVTEKINGTISIKKDQIATLKEYKTSLINSAVTGKIKVI